MPHPFGMLMVVATPVHVTSNVCWRHLSKEDADENISSTLKSETDIGSRPLQVIQCLIKLDVPAGAHNSCGCEFPRERETKRVESSPSRSSHKRGPGQSQHVAIRRRMMLGTSTYIVPEGSGHISWRCSCWSKSCTSLALQSRFCLVLVVAGGDSTFLSA